MFKTMIIAVGFLFASAIALDSNQALADQYVSAQNNGQIVYHGGGCRKDSPTGMCCHQNRKTGEYHCH